MERGVTSKNTNFPDQFRPSGRYQGESYQSDIGHVR